MLGNIISVAKKYQQFKINFKEIQIIIIKHNKYSLQMKNDTTRCPIWQRSAKTR